MAKVKVDDTVTPCKRASTVPTRGLGVIETPNGLVRVAVTNNRKVQETEFCMTFNGERFVRVVDTVYDTEKAVVAAARKFAKTVTAPLVATLDD